MAITEKHLRQIVGRIVDDAMEVEKEYAIEYLTRLLNNYPLEPGEKRMVKELIADIRANFHRPVLSHPQSNY